MAKGGKGGKGPGGSGPGGGLSGSTMGMLALFAGLILVLGGIAVADNLNLFGGDAGTASCDTLDGRGIHEHADLRVYLNSTEPFDFSPDKYQIQAGFVHFEQGSQPGPDTTVHIHEAWPTIGCLFSTLDWQVSQTQIVTDTGEVYAEDANHEIRILVDGEPAENGFRELLVGNNRYEIHYEYTGGSTDTNTSS